MTKVCHLLLAFVLLLASAALLPTLHCPSLRAAPPLVANLIVSRSISTVPLAAFSHAQKTLECAYDDAMMTFGHADAQEEEEPGHHHHHVRGQRQYEFAVEVTAGPPNSVFRHTKVITVKSKYIVENQTGMPIEIKQRGTPDLDVLQYGSTAHGRCARRLEVNERCAPCLCALSSH